MGRETDNADGSDGEQHYQPWRRDRTDATPGITCPAPLPTRNAAPRTPAKAVEPPRATEDLSADELLARPIAQPAPDSESSDAAARARAIVAQAGQAIERAEIPRRSREAGAKGAKMAARGARATAAALSSAGRRAAKATQDAISTASPHVRAAASKLSDTAQRSVKGAGDAIAKGSRRAIEATPIADIVPQRGAEPPSALDKLLAEDAADAGNTTNTTGGLPLFGESPTSIAPPPPATSPSASAPSATVPSTTVMAAQNPNSAPLTGAPPTTGDHKGGDGAGGTSGHGGGNDGGNDGRNGGSGANPTRPLPHGGSARPNAWFSHPASWVAMGAALFLGGTLFGSQWSGINRAATENIVRNYLLEHPEIIPQAVERLEHRRVSEIIRQNRDAIERPFSGAWAGAADGDVTLVVFTDYACTYCRASEPDLERLIAEDRRLKLVFREFPILSADSEAAARLALVAARSGRYMNVHQALFAAAPPNAAARGEIASRFNLNASAAALNDPGITNELRRNVGAARSLGFSATPAFIVGDKLLVGAIGYDALKAAIAEARGD
ncbi:MAG: thioredoxin domain-containing protein [Sphingomonadaceae bacterium]|nr:thioredoxin domain-containing protein [Sphingomonadaceae bacterium]